MRNFFAGLLMNCGIVGAVAAGLMIRAPLPDVPEIQSNVMNSRDGAEVAKARAALYEAEVKRYAELVEKDRELESTRPSYERWWPVYLTMSALSILLGVFVVKW